MTHTLDDRHGGPCIPQMKKVRHNGDGSMGWGWDYDSSTVVDWKVFIANLPAKKLDQILGLGDHVCRLTFEPVIGSYDSKRRIMKA